ncbi:MAG: ribonuclease P protein component [Candidatus Paceibacterota bacterium]|jgi:ribonuclease P protein component
MAEMLFPEGEEKRGPEQLFKMSLKISRLQKKSDIDSVFKKGKSFREGLILLKVLKTDLESSRFAFVISHKVSKKSTVRNKLRRRLKNIFQSFLKDGKGTSADILVIAFPGLEKKEYKELGETVERVFKRTR